MSISYCDMLMNSVTPQDGVHTERSAVLRKMQRIVLHFDKEGRKTDMAEEIKKKEELDPQEKSFRRRKDMIKNFIIVFLVVMLVLTFFSNTIMNYSLPQVAIQYIQPGTITSVIRGEGTVESGDPYNVMVKQQKTVSKIHVKVGSIVKEGDTLVSLDAEESEELKAAKKALDEAQKKYDAYLLSDAVTSAAITSSKTAITVEEMRQKITNAQAAVKAAEKNVEACQDALDAIKNQEALYLAAQSDTSELTKLKQQLDAAEAALSSASETLTAAKAAYATAEEAYTTAAAAEATAKTAYDNAQAKLTSLTEAEDIITEITTYISTYTGLPEDFDIYDANLSDEQKVTLAILIRDNSNFAAAVSAQTGIDVEYNVLVREATADRDTALAAYNSAKTATANALTAKDNANTELGKAQESYNAASDNYTNIKNAYDAASSKDTSSPYAYQKSVAEVNLSNAQKDLEDKQTALKELVSDIDAIRQLGDYADEIDKAKEEVAKLEKDSVGEDLKSPINGTILSINVSSGKKTNPDEAVVTIQPEGQGFTMSFSIDNDKAKTITVGDEATVANSWWYNDVTGVVATIRPDPNDANRKKLVTLNLQGSLTAGQTLTMSISSKTSNYDMIVPSSALRNDNKGDFVLVVESKSSPLGNRYFAVRYDVEILATDDVQTAIKGAFEGYEPVVTTATKDITEGQQIRLSDN